MSKAIPKLRFKEFEGKWVNKKLETIVEKVNSGKTPLGGESVYVPNGVLFIRSQNVLDNKLSLENSTYITEEVNSTMKNSIVRPKDILLNITGASLGRSCVVPDDFTIGNVNQHVCIIRLSKENDPYFLQPIFASEKGKNLFTSLQTGSGREGLNFQSIKNASLSFPTLPEQQKIASFLSAVDEKIHQLTRKKELLEQYKKGVMQQLFSSSELGFARLEDDRIDADDKNNPTILQSKKSKFRQLRFKDENGKAYPKWEEKRLGEIGNTFNGLTGKTKENFGQGKPYIQYMQIFANSKIDVSKGGLVQIDKNEEQQRVQYGDVFFTTSSETPEEIGTSSVLLEHVEEMYLNSFCFGFRPNSFEQLLPDFASYLFRNDIFRKVIIRLAQGSTRYNMSKVQLMKLKVLLPSKQEQQKIANFLSAIDTKIESVATQIEKTQTFKKGLLQQMFV